MEGASLKVLTMDAHEVVVYHHPNPELRSFFTKLEISTPRVEHFKKPLNADSKDRLKTLGSIGAWTAKAILDTPGVKELRIKPKEILIKREASFFWEEVEETVIKIIRHALRRKEIRIIKK